MDYSATQEIILKLKDVKEQQHLTIPQIEKMVEASGNYVSLTTLRRVFAENSEDNDSFSYENTLRPIAQALLITFGLESDDALRRARTETYEVIFKHKNEVIDSLHKQIDELKAEYETRYKDYDRRLAFLRDQIEKKDERMDRKDEIIEKLMERVLN